MKDCSSPPKVRIKSVREDEAATGGHLYEIEPLEYEGPAELEPNTVLEVVGQIDGSGADK